MHEKTCNTGARRSTSSVVSTAADFAAAPVSSSASLVFVPPPMTSASIGDRLLAHIGDWFAYALAGLAGAVLGAGASYFHHPPTDFTVFDAHPGMLPGIWIGNIAMLVFQVYRLSTTGQTIGKKMVGIRIVRTDGGRAGFVRAWFLRSALIHALSLITSPIVYLVGLFWIVDIGCLWSNHRRMLHDRIAGTRVIEV